MKWDARFVRKEYQQKPVPLFIMWQGILAYIKSNPDIKYITGPVTISNEFSSLSKNLIVSFIKKYHYDNHIAEYVQARKPYKIHSKRIDLAEMLETCSGNIKKLEKHVEEIEPHFGKIPILLKKYLKQNAKIIGFNVDLNFNKCLDGLMILDIKHLPLETIELLSKDKFA